MTPRRIEIRIEELVLHGFSPADGLRIAAALERELEGRLQADGWSDALAARGDREAVDAGSFERSPGATPGAVGEALARSVAGALGR